MRHLIASTLTALALATPALAQEVIDCDWRAQAPSIAEPWEANSRTFANGHVRLALLDVIEPAFGGFHLLVLSPPRDELGFRQCRIVTFEDSLGFAGVSFEALKAGYDPATGLSFTLPVRTHDGQGGYTARTLYLTLDQSDGVITTRLE